MTARASCWRITYVEGMTHTHQEEAGGGPGSELVEGSEAPVGICCCYLGRITIVINIACNTETLN
jgi:hypothetical protein